MKKYAVISAALALSLLCSCGSNAPNETDKSSTEKSLFSVSESASAPKEYNSQLTVWSSPSERLSNMNVIAEDGNIQLLFDERNCDIAVKSGESVYMSTPWNLTLDKRSTDIQKQTIASQINIKYMDSQKQIADISSFPECIAKGQYTTQKIKNGIQVNMVIGRAEQRSLLPSALPAESFEKVIEKLDKRPSARMKAFYKLYDPKSSPENQLELIREKFPIVDETAIYVLKEVTEKEKAEIEGYFADADYDFEDMEKDLEIVKISETETVSPRFEISVLYSLENGALKVQIPTELISFDKKNFSLLDIGVLEYLASADCNSDGYLFIPDGSGAVINFNKNGEKIGNDIRFPLYGYDRSLTYLSGYDSLKTASLPVYGIKSSSGTMIAVIDGGAAMADISASSGGMSSSYAKAGVIFSYCDYDVFDYKDVNTQYSWSLVDENSFSGVYSIDYKLLAPGSGYTEMASVYRDILKLNPKKSNGIKLVLGLLGSVEHKDEKLFIPINRQVALTTFSDASDIADDMLSSGIDNLALRYIGWSKDGLDTHAFNDAKIQKALGGKKELRKLANTLKEKNVSLYLDADFVYVKNNSLFDGFYAVGDTARMLDKTYAGYNKIRLSSGLMDSDAYKYALRPSVSEKMFGKFIKKYSGLGINGLSLGTLGSELNSDKDSKRGINRDGTLKKYDAILKTASDNYEVMTQGANAYTLQYTSLALAVPPSSSGYPDVDYSIPFLQMVLHGYVDYTSPVINLSGDYHTEILNAVANGAGLYFETAYRNSEIMKNGSHSEYYSVDYAVWKDYITELYKTVNDAIGDLAEYTITDFRYVRNGVVMTSYSSGTKIYVNYNSDDEVFDEFTVKAKSYYRQDKGE